MKNYFLLPLLLLLTLIACNHQKNSISADIDGLGNDTVFVQYVAIDESNTSKPVLDTILSANNKFVYDLPADKAYYVMLEPAKTIRYSQGPRKYKLVSEARIMFVVVAPGEKLKVKGDITPDFIIYKVSGSEFNEDHSTHRLAGKDMLVKTDSLSTKIDFYRTVPDASIEADSIARILRKELAKEHKEMSNLRMNYISNNLTKDLSAYYLIRSPKDSFALYYEKLDDKVKNGFLGNLLNDRVNVNIADKRLQENKEKIKEGASAPDFTLKNLKGENMKLSDIKGKHIVLDFWGSWCGWCVKGYPEMKKYYDKYKDKVEFVGIACKDTEKDWKKAVADNKLDWTQLINDESGDVDKNVSVLYAVQGYPTKIIIDKDMKIISVIVGEKEEFYQKLDELLK